jgi:hypothetical protein
VVIEKIQDASEKNEQISRINKGVEKVNEKITPTKGTIDLDYEMNQKEGWRDKIIYDPMGGFKDITMDLIKYLDEKVKGGMDLISASNNDINKDLSKYLRENVIEGLILLFNQKIQSYYYIKQTHPINLLEEILNENKNEINSGKASMVIILNQYMKVVNNYFNKYTLKNSNNDKLAYFFILCLK